MKKQITVYSNDIELDEYERDLESNLEHCTKLDPTHKKAVVIKFINWAKNSLDMNLDGKVINVTNHYNQEKYHNQKIAHVLMLGTVYLVPFIIKNEDSILFKTSFFSNKASALYSDYCLTNKS